jgi:hypothetical protein
LLQTAEPARLHRLNHCKLLSGSDGKIRYIQPLKWGSFSTSAGFDRAGDALHEVFDGFGQFEFPDALRRLEEQIAQDEDGDGGGSSRREDHFRHPPLNSRPRRQASPTLAVRPFRVFEVEIVPFPGVNLTDEDQQRIGGSACLKERQRWVESAPTPTANFPLGQVFAQNCGHPLGARRAGFRFGEDRVDLAEVLAALARGRGTRVPIARSKARSQIAL